MNYKFDYVNNENNSYLFETSLGIAYEVKFKPSSYLLGNEYTVYANCIYEFVIEILVNPLEKKLSIR